METVEEEEEEERIKTAQMIKLQRDPAARPTGNIMEFRRSMDPGSHVDICDSVEYLECGKEY